MKKTKIWVALLAVSLLTSGTAYPQARRTQPQAMTRWVGKYPDDKFFNQPLIKRPLRRILSKADYDSIKDYALMGPNDRVGDYLVAGVQIPYDIERHAITLAFNLKDGAVYIVFREGETSSKHRKFSTKNNQFDLPKEVLEVLGL